MGVGRELGSLTKGSAKLLGREKVPREKGEFWKSENQGCGYVYSTE